MARLVIHAGTGKTGTSSVQASILKNKEALASQGIVFLESILSKPGKSAKHGLEWMKFGSRERRALKAEAARLAKTDKTVILSNEALWKRTAKDLRLLKKLFKGFDVQIILYVREQVEYMESRTLQAMKKGQKVLALDFSDPENPAGLDRFLNQFAPHLDYLDVASRWEQVFGEGALQARLYSRDRFPGGNVVADFYTAIGASIESLDLSSEVNPSLSVPFAVITANRDKYLPPDVSRSEALDAGLRLSKLRKSNIPRLISPEKAAEIRNRVVESNQVFFAKYVVNGEEFKVRDWQSEGNRGFREFADEMVQLISKWPLILFNGFGPKQRSKKVFSRGWLVEGDAPHFEASQCEPEAAICFRIHLRAKLRSGGNDLNLWLKCSEATAVRGVKVAGNEIGEIDVCCAPIPIPASSLGEFDNVEVVLLTPHGSEATLTVRDLRIETGGENNDA